MVLLLLACADASLDSGVDSQAGAEDVRFAASRLALGAYHTCSVWDGAVQCWGDDTHGQLSAPDEELLSVASDVFHTCGLTPDGRAVCWGLNTAGQCDAPANSFIDVDAGTTTSCGVTSEGSIECWGRDLGVAPEGPFVEVGVGTEHICALDAAGGVECWGTTNDWGEQDVPAMGVVDHLVVGGFFACALDELGQVHCWGRNDVGQATPAEGEFIQIDVAVTNGCGLLADRTPKCWGGDAEGAVRDAPSTAFDEVGMGSHFGCATDGGRVSCWGENAQGQASPN